MSDKVSSQIIKARKDIAAARLLETDFPVQAFRLLGDAARSALMATCMADGWDFESDTPEGQMLSVMSDDVFGRCGKRRLTAFLQAARTMQEEGSFGDDFLVSPKDFECVTAFVEDADAYVEGFHPEMPQQLAVA